MNSTTLWPHQWPSDFALKTDRWELVGSIPGCGCRLSRLEFYFVLSETQVNTGKNLLEKPPRRTLPLQTRQTIGLKNHYPNQPNHVTHNQKFLRNCVYSVRLLWYETIQNFLSLDLMLFDMKGINFLKFSPLDHILSLLVHTFKILFPFNLRRVRAWKFYCKSVSQFKIFKNLNGFQNARFFFSLKTRLKLISILPQVT